MIYRRCGRSGLVLPAPQQPPSPEMMKVKRWLRTDLPGLVRSQYQIQDYIQKMSQSGKSVASRQETR